MLPLLLATALAAEPVVERAGPGEVAAYVDVPADADTVFAVVEVPGQVARISGGSTKVQTSPDGDCLLVATRTEHPIATVEYRTRACRDGERAVKQELVDGDMKAFESRWWVEPREGGGARLHYRLKTVPDMPIPQFVVDRNAAKSVKTLMVKLRDHFTR